MYLAYAYGDKFLFPGVVFIPEDERGGGMCEQRPTKRCVGVALVVALDNLQAAAGFARK